MAPGPLTCEHRYLLRRQVQLVENQVAVLARIAEALGRRGVPGA